jgi:hypothetical protein
VEVAATALTAVTAVAALWTVRLSYRALGVARDAAQSASESAKDGKQAVEQIGRVRERDHLDMERRRLLDLHAEVEALGRLQFVASGDRDWRGHCNRVGMLLAGANPNALPATRGLVIATTRDTAKVQDARLELESELTTIEGQIHALR